MWPILEKHQSEYENVRAKIPLKIICYLTSAKLLSLRSRSAAEAISGSDMNRRDCRVATEIRLSFSRASQ